MDWIEISKAEDWEGIGTGVNIRIEGMEYPTTVYVIDADDLERKIEEVKSKFSARFPAVNPS